MLYHNFLLYIILDNSSWSLKRNVIKTGSNQPTEPIPPKIRPIIDTISILDRMSSWTSGDVIGSRLNRLMGSVFTVKPLGDPMFDHKPNGCPRTNTAIRLKFGKCNTKIVTSGIKLVTWRICTTGLPLSHTVCLD